MTTATATPDPAASPRPRGWTRGLRRRVDHAPGFPAPAGMDPRLETDYRVRHRLPRARGDGPLLAVVTTRGKVASPRPRGWTRGSRPAGRRRDGFPAPAGMDRACRWPPGRSRGLPRARGDGPHYSDLYGQVVSASPRPRGWTRAAVVRVAPRQGFPAPAGMDRARSSRSRGSSRLPRARGDGPTAFQEGARTEVASPRPRGWTPVLVGMDRARSSRSRGSSRLPRARGDGPTAFQEGARTEVASPRPRGWTRARDRGRLRLRGFPAPAGMDRRRASSRCSGARLPRARGDGPSRRCRPTRPRRASPRPRGWTLPRVDPADARDGFPAPAGMDPATRSSSDSRIRLPRARGDGPAADRQLHEMVEASPRPRGWTAPAHRLLLRAEGFPAPAGMDPRPRARTPAPRWLPRARGDGPHRSRIRGTAAAGFPAPAGMDPPRPSRPRPGTRLPRARGDGPTSKRKRL